MLSCFVDNILLHLILVLCFCFFFHKGTINDPDVQQIIKQKYVKSSHYATM